VYHKVDKAKENMRPDYVGIPEINKYFQSHSELDVRGIGVRFSVNDRDYYFLQKFGSRGPSACYSIGTGYLSPEIRRSECKTKHFPHPVPRLGISGPIPPLPHLSSFRAQRQVYL
jgi:hypothetical protein